MNLLKQLPFFIILLFNVSAQEQDQPYPFDADVTDTTIEYFEPLVNDENEIEYKKVILKKSGPTGALHIYVRDNSYCKIYIDGILRGTGLVMIDTLTPGQRVLTFEYEGRIKTAPIYVVPDFVRKVDVIFRKRKFLQ